MKEFFMFDDDETAEDIRERREKVKKEYGKLYDSISEILFRYDPIGINFETNDDEYEPEVDTILPRLKNCKSAENVLDVVFEEFQKWFDEEIAGERSNYKEISSEIWHLWETRKVI